MQLIQGPYPDDLKCWKFDPENTVLSVFAKRPYKNADIEVDAVNVHIRLPENCLLQRMHRPDGVSTEGFFDAANKYRYL
jgi:hypothetical protein